MIKGTISAWATSLGKEPRTLERALAKAGIEKPPPRQAIEARVIFQALASDEKQIKKALLEEDLKERQRENSEAAGELVRMADVEKLLAEKVIVPLRQLLMSAPSQLDTRCNPKNPELARKTIEAWRDDALKQLRDKVAG